MRHDWGMSHVVWKSEPPQLRSPVVLIAFKGWFDIGGAATGALEWITEFHGCDQVAYIDPEEFYDFSEERPRVLLDADGQRMIAWPSTNVYTLRSAKSEPDLLIMVGEEPHLRWRTFTDTVVEIVTACESSLVLTVGAHIADIPHTRPFVVAGSTSDAELAEAWRLERPSYEGPTGVVGALHHRLQQTELPAVSLRVAVPHYVSGAPNPKGSRALLERIERITGLSTGWAELDEAAMEWESRVNAAMDSDEDVVNYVRRLEARSDARTEQSLPSPDDIGAEFELFLRRQGDGESS